MKPVLKVTQSETVGHVTYIVAELNRHGVLVYALIKAVGPEVHVISTHLDEAHAVTGMIRATQESLLMLENV